MTVFFSIFLAVSSSYQIFCTDFNPQKRHCQIFGGINGTCFRLHTFHLFYRSIVSTWLPIVIGTCLNLLIIIKLFQANHNRKRLIKNRNQSIKMDNKNLISNINLNSNKSIKKEKQITIMLVTLSLTFIVLTLPYSIYEILRKAEVIGKILDKRYHI